MTWNDNVNDVDIVELELFGVTLYSNVCNGSYTQIYRYIAHTRTHISIYMHEA